MTLLLNEVWNDLEMSGQDAATSFANGLLEAGALPRFQHPVAGFGQGAAGFGHGTRGMATALAALPEQSRAAEMTSHQALHQQNQMHAQQQQQQQQQAGQQAGQQQGQAGQQQGQGQQQQLSQQLSQHQQHQQLQAQLQHAAQLGYTAAHEEGVPDFDNFYYTEKMDRTGSFYRIESFRARRFDSFYRAPSARHAKVLEEPLGEQIVVEEGNDEDDEDEDAVAQRKRRSSLSAWSNPLARKRSSIFSLGTAPLILPHEQLNLHQHLQLPQMHTQLHFPTATPAPSPASTPMSSPAAALSAAMQPMVPPPPPSAPPPPPQQQQQQQPQQQPPSQATAKTKTNATNSRKQQPQQQQQQQQQPKTAQRRRSSGATSGASCVSPRSSQVGGGDSPSIEAGGKPKRGRKRKAGQSELKKNILGEKRQQRPTTTIAKASLTETTKALADGKPRNANPDDYSLSTKKRPLTSKFKGVCWYKRTKKWVVQVKMQGVRAHIGYFSDELEAAEAYKNAMAEIQRKLAAEGKPPLPE